MQEPIKVSLLVSEDEDSDSDEDGMLKLSEWNHDDSDISGNEEEESSPKPRSQVIARKKRVPFKDAVISNPKSMQEKLETKNINDSHRKWGYYGEKRHRSMGKLMVISLEKRRMYLLKKFF